MRAIRKTSRAMTDRRRCRGLSLMETSLATMIVGSAVLGLVKLTFSLTLQSGYSQKITTACLLANNVREMMADLPFNDPLNGTHTGGMEAGETVANCNDVQDFNGAVINPPVDAHRQPIAALANYRQEVTVTLIGDNVGHSLAGVTGNLGAVVERVTVTVSYQKPDGTWAAVAATSWLKTKY